MTSIELERLIVRQRYFVPIVESRLKDSILKELQADEPKKIPTVKRWYIGEEHKHSFTCEFSYRYYHVYVETLGKKGAELRRLVKEKLKKYKEGLPEIFYKGLNKKVGDSPDSIHVHIVKADKEGCICEVECFPILYRQLRQLPSKRKEVTEFKLQIAYLTSRRFLKTIFESGLSATLVSEEKKELPKPTIQLLINDQASRQILGKVDEMLEQTTGEVLLCGWIGTLLLPKLREIKEKGVNIRVVTHKAKELKGKPGHQDVQRAFRELVSMLGKDNISIRPECHCRVVVVDNKALIGSMDINAISLTGSHRELAIYTEDPEIVRNLRKYFNEIFSPLSKEKAK